MNIYLAPMEGVIDQPMRALLTAVGGYTHCVTEFIRVVDRRLPARVFQRYCPELAHGGRTAAGIPVVVQLLGGIPEAMAENAARAAALGAPGIDINFGCPSRFVNRNAGGAVLLQEPERVYAITRAVRAAVPAHIPVSAKIRLGYDTTDLALDNAHAVQSAGAGTLTVHARTKIDGYKHPARWEWLARIKEQLAIPMIANGDINSVDDYHRCRATSGCDSIMLGRGALACPDLARQIHAAQRAEHVEAADWNQILELLIGYTHTLRQFEPDSERYVAARVKQWLIFLKGRYTEAQGCFQEVRALKDGSAVVAGLERIRLQFIADRRSLALDPQ